MSEPIDEWNEMPIMLTVEDAARVLRISRSRAYEMTKQYTASGGTAGLPCLRLGDLVRVPKFALHEFVTTGRVGSADSTTAPERDYRRDWQAPVGTQVPRERPVAAVIARIGLTHD